MGNESLLSLFGGGTERERVEVEIWTKITRGVEIDRGGNYGFFSSNLALPGILRVNIGPERDNNRIRKGHKVGNWKVTQGSGAPLPGAPAIR